MRHYTDFCRNMHLEIILSSPVTSPKTKRKITAEISTLSSKAQNEMENATVYAYQNKHSSLRSPERIIFKDLSTTICSGRSWIAFVDERVSIRLSWKSLNSFSLCGFCYEIVWKSTSNRLFQCRRSTKPCIVLEHHWKDNRITLFGGQRAIAQV